MQFWWWQLPWAVRKWRRGVADGASSSASWGDFEDAQRSFSSSCIILDQPTADISSSPDSQSIADQYQICFSNYPVWSKYLNFWFFNHRCCSSNLAYLREKSRKNGVVHSISIAFLIWKILEISDSQFKRKNIYPDQHKRTASRETLHSHNRSGHQNFKRVLKTNTFRFTHFRRRVFTKDSWLTRSWNAPETESMRLRW